MKLHILFLALGVFSFLIGCSFTNSTTKEKLNDDQDYVFDKIPIDDSSNVYLDDNNPKYEYIIQLGAFTTKSAAENFAESVKTEVNSELSVEPNVGTGLYKVRLENIFRTRTEAEKIRNELWQHDRFKDAWIVKKTKQTPSQD